MRNFVAPGDNIEVTAPAAVLSGAGVLIGSLFGVATMDAAINTPVVISTQGVFDLPKAPSQAWTVGQVVHWDTATNRATNVATTPPRPIGMCVRPVPGGATDIIGRVRLNGINAG